MDINTATTAQLRSAAYEASCNGDSARAAELYTLAADRHPERNNTGSALARADISHLRDLARQFGSMIR